MSLKLIDRIYENLKDSFNEREIKENEIDMIKDMIHFEGEKGPNKMRKLNEKWKEKYGAEWNKVFLFEVSFYS
jgi:hypothetical protein